MMDPPWQLSSSQPSRGVAIAYDSLSDENIMKMPIDKLQTDGFIFIWYKKLDFRINFTDENLIFTGRLTRNIDFHAN